MYFSLYIYMYINTDMNLKSTKLSFWSSSLSLNTTFSKYLVEPTITSMHYYTVFKK